MQDPKESPTKGTFNIVVDAEIAGVMQAERSKFEELYPSVKIRFDTATARGALVQFFNIDSIKVIATSRPMNDEERAVAKRANFQFSEFKFALTGVAVITNTENTADSLRTTQLDSIFSAKINRWSEVGGPKSAGPILVCLPDVNNASFEIVGSEILNGGKFAPPVQLAKTPAEMVEFVKENIGAIGILGLNTLQGYTNDVRVLELCDPAAADTLNLRTTYFAPYPAYLYERFYPLVSEVYLYSKTDIYSPGSGFIGFVCSAPGQKIIQSNGLVPATMPVRLVDLTQ